jgi:hypothetical protein
LRRKNLGPLMSLMGHSRPTGHSLTSRDVRNCSKAELGWCCGKFPTERVGETVPAGGRRHELGDSFRSLLANSLRTEATFLPDHASEKLHWKGVLRRRLFQRAAKRWGMRGDSVGIAGGRTVGRCGVAPACAFAGAFSKASSKPKQ